MSDTEFSEAPNYPKAIRHPLWDETTFFFLFSVALNRKRMCQALDFVPLLRLRLRFFVPSATPLLCEVP